MRRLRIYRIILIILLVINIVFLGYYYLYSVTSGIPDSIKVYVGDKSSFDFDMPVAADVNCSKEVLSISNASSVDNDNIHFSFAEPFTVESDKKGQYEISLKLFGLLDLKKVSLDVIDSTYLTPCGNAIGIRLDTDGLLVLGTGKVEGTDGLEYEPARQIIRTGDYIVAVNGKKVNSIRKMQQLLNKNKKKEAIITIRRKGTKSKIKLPTVRTEDGDNKLGIWVRENTQGIGTMTYVTDEGKYGALGHGITDSDTGVLMSLGKGSIYETEILRIIKGKNGIPGEIMGMILETPAKRIGSIDINTSLGISGTINPEYTGLYSESCSRLPVALRQDIRKGNATILCQLDDNVREYNIDIIDINAGSDDNKGLVIQITDEELLEKTGGIIQGMSGSPIIQDGKLVGAVTHVFVNDPTKGYGIMIENML